MHNLKKAIAYVNKLPDEQFEFSYCVMGKRRPKEGFCQTSGCFIGWMPNVFPTMGKWVHECSSGADLECSNPEFAGLDYEDIAVKLFGMSRDVAHCLFTPHLTPDLHPDLPVCISTATPKQVCTMLRKYIELVKALG